MAKLIEQMINYNDENLKDLDEHIEKQSKKSKKSIVRMIVKHNGPTDVKLTEESAKKCAEIILK